MSTIGTDKILRAASFYAGLLKLDEFKLKIKIKKTLKTNGYIERISRKKFKIVLAEDGEDLFCSLAHEMVHMSQYLNGRMKDTFEGVLWDGVFYPDDDSPDGYYDSPWEIEAFGRQRGMYERYLMSLEGEYNVLHGTDDGGNHRRIQVKP